MKKIILKPGFIFHLFIHLCAKHCLELEGKAVNSAAVTWLHSVTTRGECSEPLPKVSCISLLVPQFAALLRAPRYLPKGEH